MKGRPFGPYRLRKLIRRDGDGDLYRAYDPPHGHDVALKVLHSRLSDDVEFLDRFQRRFDALARLVERRLIVRIHD